MKKYTRQQCEFLRQEAKNKFDNVRGTWCDSLRWALPHRATWILSLTPGERKNQNIVDTTHILALRSFVAGFLEGNTSASRPWYRIGSRDVELNEEFETKQWLQHYTTRTLNYLSSSNFYDAAGEFYYDYGVVNTGAHYFEELANGFFVHTLMPGSYFVINDSYGVACILIREFSLNVKAVVDTYAREDANGRPDWSNVSSHVKKMYQDSNYGQMIDIAQCIQQNDNFDIENPDDPNNRQWIELTYELGSKGNNSFSAGNPSSMIEISNLENKFLKKHTQKRKPFVIGKSTKAFEYGEKGPTLDALGTIKSLNKKAIGKDQALEQILHPAVQGPASLRKNYLSTAPNTYVPLDARAVAAKQKLESIFQINPAIGAIVQDVGDLRGFVDKLYYADFLLYLTKNPKTRTATETDAILEEQQRVIGPNLQSLTTTYNNPVLEWVMDYVLFEDPYLRPPPAALQGQILKPEYVSVFAQAQKAADLPAVNRYVAMISSVAQIDPKILQKINTDKLADIYEDRLYLPSGLNNPQGKVDAMREQAQQQLERDKALQETIPAMAKAAKDASAVQQ